MEKRDYASVFGHIRVTRTRDCPLQSHNQRFAGAMSTGVTIALAMCDYLRQHRVRDEATRTIASLVCCVTGGSQTPRLPCSTCSPQVVSHFLGDTALNSEYSQNLQASLQSIQRAMEHTQFTGREANAQSHASERAQTHTHTLLQVQQESQRAFIHYRTIQVVH